MIFDTINSSVLIYDIIDRYAIQSNDFATRTPDWIVSAIREIGIRNNLVTRIYKSAFSNNRILLPSFCETVDRVLINDRKVDYAESLYIIDSMIDSSRELMFLGDPTKHDFNNQLISSTSVSSIDPDFADGNNSMFYRIENGWLHTNVKYGTIEIKYKKIPTVMDEMFAIEFPLIPDGQHTKEAVILYILKTLLMRGYVHPILSLKENNPLINPGLAYINERVQARIENNSPNRDAREKYSHPMSALFGKRRSIWIKQDITEGVIEEPTERWIADGSPYCELLNNFHTGYKLIPKKKQVKAFDEWVDTSETKIDKEYDITSCPLLYMRAGYSIGLSGYVSPTYINFTSQLHETIVISANENYNYLYVSIPAGKTFFIIDSGIDTTSEFELFGQDNVEGYTYSNVYRSKNTFYTGLGFEFILMIE